MTSTRRLITLFLITTASVAQTLRIDNNPALTSIDHAFASLTTCGSLQLTELPKLQRVPADAFASLAEVKGNVAGPADVIRDLTKYVDEDDDEDDVEAIAPAPRHAPPAGWGKLLSA